MVGTKDSSHENSSYLRKVRKPLVEKKRRDRMNHSISVLKMLIADTIKEQTTPMTRLDKADILELTVYHLTRVQQQQRSVALATEVASYNKGFKECARATVHYLQNNNSVPENVTNNLNSHLHRTFLSRDQQHKIQQHSQQHLHKNGYASMNSSDKDITKTRINRLSTPVRDNRLGLSTHGMNTPTFSPIFDANTSLPHPSASFVRSNLDFTPNSSSSSYSDMSVSNCSSKSGSVYQSDSSQNGREDVKLTTGSGVVTIGDSAEDKVGHVIKETTWRPW